MKIWFSFGVCVVLGALAGDTAADRPLPDYRYFRALSLDLLGRPPTFDELAELERPDFRFDTWIDRHLQGPAYAERLRRVYMDELRLEASPTTQYDPPGVALRRAQIAGPAGPIVVYYRNGQRRADPMIDGAFCFTEAETGLRVLPEGAPQGVARPITRQLLDARTIEVKPWWLYADYRAPSPHDRAGADWAKRFPGYELFLPAFNDPDGTPTTSIRVCKEEAQTSPTGHVVTTGRVFRPGMTIPQGRSSYPPFDSSYAQAHAHAVVSCTSGIGFQSSPDCGCGVGLERCLPVTPQGFEQITHDPLGVEDPFYELPRTSTTWIVGWWSEEAKHYMDDLFESDGDVRDLLRGRWTMINGPLAQFYHLLAGSSCCGTGSELGYVDPEPLFDPKAVPPDLRPEDAARWTRVADRGAHAAGLLTMPVFLLKYGTRRARAHVLYNTFLCRDFVSDAASLPPSTEPDLTKRPGCSDCHRTLEPMAAYFSRVAENDWTYLPAAEFPTSLSRCAGTRKKKPPGCNAYYDPAFATATTSSLRGSYASPQHADAGPAGLADEITRSPEFAPCVVKHVAQSLLGRTLGPDDATWQAELTKGFVAGGYRMRGLTRAILTSSRYRDANDRKPEVPR